MYKVTKIGEAVIHCGGPVVHYAVTRSDGYIGVLHLHVCPATGAVESMFYTVGGLAAEATFDKDRGEQVEDYLPVALEALERLAGHPLGLEA